MADGDGTGSIQDLLDSLKDSTSFWVVGAVLLVLLVAAFVGGGGRG